jgi:hypothetical protein
LRLGSFCLGDVTWQFTKDGCSRADFEGFSDYAEGGSDNAEGASDNSEGASHNSEEASENEHSADSDPENNTYMLVKRRFEVQCMKVNDPFMYIRLSPQHDKGGAIKPIQTRHCELLQFYVAWKYFGKNKKGEWEKRSFIHAWVQDDKKREVSSVVFDPKNSCTGVFNMWMGYRAANIDHELYLTEIQDRYDFVMGPIINHFNQVVTGGNQDHTEWILDWVANIIQRPWLKTQVGIVLYGRPGCGKGIFFDWLRDHVLGVDHSVQIANTNRDLFSRFSDQFLRKTFLQLDEVHNLHENADLLKDMITNKTVNWEEKNGKITTVANLCNFLFTTNHENSLQITPDDRRFVLFPCRSHLKGNVAYFNKLGKHLETPGVNAWFYRLMMERDLSKYPFDFQPSRPITDYYREVQKSGIKPVKRFLSALINSDSSSKKISSSELFRGFKEWCDFESCKHATTLQAFGRDLNKVRGIVSSKSGCIHYSFDFKRVKLALEEDNEYDENAYLHKSI